MSRCTDRAPAHFALRKFQPEIWEMSDASVASLGAGDDHFYVMIARIDGIRSLWPAADQQPDIAKQIGKALRPDAALSDIAELPLWDGAEATHVFLLRRKTLDGRTFRAVRWIGKHRPEQDEILDPLYYFAEGLSRDGRITCWCVDRFRTPRRARWPGRWTICNCAGTTMSIVSRCTRRWNGGWRQPRRIRSTRIWTSWMRWCGPCG